MYALKAYSEVFWTPLIFHSLIVSNDNDFDSKTKILVDDKRKKSIMAFEAMKQMKLYNATEMYTTMWIFITNFYRMGIGITASVESK